MQEKIVGILGGMGPEATVDFMQRVIKLTPAADDCDHIRMLIDNNPKIPSRIKAIIEGTGEDPAPHLLRMAQDLEKQGADFLVIPCNTAHYYVEQISARVTVPILNMVELTVDDILFDKPGIRCVGLLASTAVLKINLYRDFLNKKGVEIIYPPEKLQDKVLEAIKNIKSGKQDSSDIKHVQNAADTLVRLGAEVIIVGCTELSVIAGEITFNCSMYDSSQILAEHVVQFAKGTT